MPTSNISYWDKKFASTVARDAENQRQLELLGWNVLIIWECELKDAAALQQKLQFFYHNIR